MLLALAAVWLIVLAVALRRLFRPGAPGRVQRLVAGLLLPPAVLYLAFLALWGLNYRRFRSKRS